MSEATPLTAREAGLVGCRRCGRVWPIETEECGRCGAHLQSRDPRSLSRVWAWWAAGLIAYVPANLYPMLVTSTLVEETQATIVGGAVELAQHDALGVAIIVLVASVLIPVGKFMAIAFLALSVHRQADTGAHARHKLYEIVEYIGRWSMIDVFVVAILTALVQLNALASIHPGPAAAAFAASVVFTMLSAQSFDSRMIWDHLGGPRPRPRLEERAT
ncbi:paraquat-inducible protein A [Pseudoroseicyclus tamaricis]|uniref:Paraquat-inducible membrane protein A n=1 Tax=Pseudoroseicyclus tamaricis TaxID=2705421 RepID=A0A6B2JJP4_9RHOB|nr:paraquat-inducible protein A [Pseudoroseicyclus tamaricis]NDV01663.1 paraquat-inducible membrane protein A [Pseudoroseicyclus tamaricis]